MCFSRSTHGSSSTVSSTPCSCSAERKPLHERPTASAAPSIQKTILYSQRSSSAAAVRPAPRETRRTPIKKRPLWPHASFTPAKQHEAHDRALFHNACLRKEAECLSHQQYAGYSTHRWEPAESDSELVEAVHFWPAPGGEAQT